MPYQIPVVQNPRNMGLNPLATGISSFFGGLSDEYAAKQKEQEQERQKEAYYTYMEEILGRKIEAQQPLTEAKIGALQAKAKGPTSAGVQAGKLQLEQDKQALKMIQEAQSLHQKYIEDAVGKNLILQSMDPTDPRYTAAIDQMNKDFSNKHPSSAALLTHAKDIQGKILARNPSLKGIDFTNAAPPPDDGQGSGDMGLPAVNQPGQ